MFAEDFDAVVQSTKDSDLASAKAVLRLLQEMQLRGLIVLPPQTKLSLEQSLNAKADGTPVDGKDNWGLVQRVMKHAGQNLDSSIGKMIAGGKTSDLQLFLYELFNAYCKLKDQTIFSTTFNKSVSSPLTLHNGVTSVDQCGHCFEKIVFLASKAAKVQPLEVK